MSRRNTTYIVNNLIEVDHVLVQTKSAKQYARREKQLFTEDFLESEVRLRFLHVHGFKLPMQFVTGNMYNLQYANAERSYVGFQFQTRRVDLDERVQVVHFG